MPDSAAMYGKPTGKDKMMEGSAVYVERNEPRPCERPNGRTQQKGAKGREG
jgi:hypothetical protein